MGKNQHIIKTERLFLREMKAEDADMVVVWRSDPEVYRYFLHPHKVTREEHVSWFHDCYLEDHNRLDWICIAEDIPIGVFGIKRECSGSKTAEVSYLVETKAQHKGYAREAVEGVLAWAIAEWDIHNVIAEIHKDNCSSRRFIESLGFCPSGEEGDFILYKKIVENKAFLN